MELSSEQNLRVKLVRNQETDIRKNPEVKENEKIKINREKGFR